MGADMGKVKTAELTGPALDWAVAKCEDYWATIKPAEVVYVHRETGEWHHNGNWQPSAKWVQGGPIIERENITITNHIGYHPTRAGEEWIAKIIGKPIGVGPTPLIAAMRAYVASKLGEDIEIPKELL